MKSKEDMAGKLRKAGQKKGKREIVEKLDNLTHFDRGTMGTFFGASNRSLVVGILAQKPGSERRRG